MTTQAQSAYNGAVTRGGQAAAGAEDEYLRRSRAFDPYAAAEKSARGQFSMFRDVLNKDVRKLRGEQVGMGRLDTGWAQQDEDELVSDSYDRLNDTIMANANNAASMELSHINGMGNYGLQRSGMFYDLLSGQLDREQAAKNARDSRRGGLWSAIGSIGGAGIGMLAGNPLLGAQLGGYLGGAAGGFGR